MVPRDSINCTAVVVAEVSELFIIRLQLYYCCKNPRRQSAVAAVPDSHLRTIRYEVTNRSTSSTRTRIPISLVMYTLAPCQ